MPTTGDLINLETLVLTDTFNTWLNRTNQLVDSVNPLQVYDVDVGAGSTAYETGAGLAKYTGEVAGNYNGVITLGVNPGPGVGYESISGQSRSIVDFSNYQTYGRVLSGGGTAASVNRVASSDEYIVNDISDTTTSSKGTAKSVKARHMLPPEVEMDVLTISGNVVIKGNLSTLGAQDFIASNNLRIEDKQIEIGYQQAVILGMTGVTSGSFTAGNLGATAYYFTNASTLTASFYGKLQSFASTVTGPTGTLFLGSLFQDPYGPEDVGATGYISLFSNGSTRYLFNQNNGITNSFLSNIALDEGGIVLKGSEGDKSLLWIWTDNDTGQYYDSWQASTNLGVNGDTNAIISRVYRSFGYTGIDQSQFIFAAENNKDAEVYFAQTDSTVTPLNFTGGSWRISKKNSTNILEVSVGAAGVNGLTTSFLITPGASGTTYAGIITTNYAKYLNADMVDGAHASTVAAPYTIPVADQYAKVDGEFLNADAVRRRYTQANHNLTAGLAVRIVEGGGFTSALATTPENAELIGVVSAVHSSSEFTVTHKGRIDNLNGSLMTLEGTTLTAGVLYFLGASANSRGKWTSDPDYSTATRVAVGQVRRPLLLALSATSGYVVSYPGVAVKSPTDQVYLYGLVPVGTIQTYGGDLNKLPLQWLLCDGKKYRAVDYPDLYGIIGSNFNARITVTAATGTSTNSVGIISGGTRNIEIGDILRFKNVATGSEYSVRVGTVTSSTSEITFTDPTSFATLQVLAGTYNAVGVTDANDYRIFFVPDMRSRVAMGGNTGDSNYYLSFNSSAGLSAHAFGEYDGNENVNLDVNQIPNHTHNTTTQTHTPGGAQTVIQTVGNVASSSTVANKAIDLHTPYMVLHYIIRAKPHTDALILTGHHHDDRYHRLNYPVFTLTAASNNAISETVPSNSFNVIAATGVAGTNKQQRTILSVYADQTPLQNGGSNTEVTVRGDFYVYANGLTAEGFTSAPRYGETFLVRPNISTVSIVGGTGSSITLTRPQPVLSFVNGVSGGVAIGTIVGLSLTANITGDSHGVSKYYSDTSDKTIKNTDYYNDWAVRHDPTAVTTRDGIIGVDPLGTAIIKARYDRGNLASTIDSQLQTYVFGDFTVFGDGLTNQGNRTGHSTVTFAVDPMTSTVTIAGNEGGTGKSSPQLSFINDADPTYSQGKYLGTINGLTFPTLNHQAVNKEYVWNVSSNIVRKTAYMSRMGQSNSRGLNKQGIGGTLNGLNSLTDFQFSNYYQQLVLSNNTLYYDDPYYDNIKAETYLSYDSYIREYACGPFYQFKFDEKHRNDGAYGLSFGYGYSSLPVSPQDRPYAGLTGFYQGLGVIKDRTATSYTISPYSIFAGLSADTVGPPVPRIMNILPGVPWTFHNRNTMINKNYIMRWAEEHSDCITIEPPLEMSDWDYCIIKIKPIKSTSTAGLDYAYNSNSYNDDTFRFDIQDENSDWTTDVLKQNGGKYPTVGRPYEIRFERGQIYLGNQYPNLEGIQGSNTITGPFNNLTDALNNCPLDGFLSNLKLEVAANYLDAPSNFPLYENISLTSGAEQLMKRAKYYWSVGDASPRAAYSHVREKWNAIAKIKYRTFGHAQGPEAYKVYSFAHRSQVPDNNTAFNYTHFDKRGLVFVRLKPNHTEPLYYFQHLFKNGPTASNDNYYDFTRTDGNWQGWSNKIQLRIAYTTSKRYNFDQTNDPYEIISEPLRNADTSFPINGDTAGNLWHPVLGDNARLDSNFLMPVNQQIITDPYKRIDVKMENLFNVETTFHRYTGYTGPRYGRT